MPPGGAATTLQAGVGDVTKLYRCQEAAVVKERPVKSSEQSPRWVFKKAISKVEAYRLLGRCPEDFSPASLFGPVFGSDCGSSPSTDAKPKDSSRCSLLTQAQVKASFSYQPHHICPNPSSNTYCSSHQPRNSAECTERHQHVAKGSAARSQRIGGGCLEVCLVMENDTSLSLPLDAPQRATSVLEERWEGHNLLPSHGFFNGRFDLLP